MVLDISKNKTIYAINPKKDSEIKAKYALTIPGTRC